MKPIPATYPSKTRTTSHLSGRSWEDVSPGAKVAVLFTAGFVPFLSQITIERDEADGPRSRWSIARLGIYLGPLLLRIVLDTQALNFVQDTMPKIYLQWDRQMRLYRGDPRGKVSSQRLVILAFLPTSGGLQSQKVTGLLSVKVMFRASMEVPSHGFRAREVTIIEFSADH